MSIEYNLYWLVQRDFYWIIDWNKKTRKWPQTYVLFPQKGMDINILSVKKPYFFGCNSSDLLLRKPCN
jgi:hypothetical protein